VPSGKLAISLTNPHLLAGIFAAITAWRFQNTWITIGVGMLGFWLFSAIS
jgi:branched-subunit amino acid transport protein